MFVSIYKLSGHYRLFFKGAVDGMVGGLRFNKDIMTKKRAIFDSSFFLRLTAE